MKEENKSIIIERTVEYVKGIMAENDCAHDRWHIYRVWNLAKTIAIKEKCDLFIVEMCALLHDVGDYKFHNGDEEIGYKKIIEFLETLDLDSKTIEYIYNIIKNISFLGRNNKIKFESIELDIIRDADKLDAIGAIGIARTFAYGGKINRSLWDPEVRPNPDMSKEQYKNKDTNSVNHFYEKILLLKGLMRTHTGKQMSEHRHIFMEKFLDEFFAEWDGKI